MLLSHITYLWVIVESVGAGLILSLINNYILSKNMFETCMPEEEEEDGSEVVSVATGISDASTFHHIHV